MQSNLTRGSIDVTISAADRGKAQTAHLFALEFARTGNGKQAAIAAGVDEKKALAASKRLLARADVIAAINEINAVTYSEQIADITEIRKLWTSMLRGQELGCFDPAPRLKASEYLGKSLGAFLDAAPPKVVVEVVIRNEGANDAPAIEHSS